MNKSKRTEQNTENKNVTVTKKKLNIHSGLLEKSIGVQLREDRHECFGGQTLSSEQVIGGTFS